jgi:hypothetical protein
MPEIFRMEGCTTKNFEFCGFRWMLGVISKPELFYD